jgi:hypothetical protein
LRQFKGLLVGRDHAARDPDVRVKRIIHALMDLVRLVEKASRAPELVVVQPLKHNWKCHRCGGTDNLLIMENPGPACLPCGGLGDLAFLPTGDATLTLVAIRSQIRSEVSMIPMKTPPPSREPGARINEPKLRPAGINLANPFHRKRFPVLVRLEGPIRAKHQILVLEAEDHAAQLLPTHSY